MHRRRVLGTLGAVGAMSLAGCALLQDTFRESASAAGVAPPTLDETGFEHRSTEELAFERTVDALGQSRDLRLTNWLVTYGKAVGEFGPDAAQFRLFSTPSVTVAGNELNPFEGFDDEELLGEVGGGGEGEFEEGNVRTVETLGSDVTYTRYETQRQVGGQSVTAHVHVGRFSNDGDLLAAIGAYPAALDQSGDIYELARNVVHPYEFEGQRT